MQLVGSAGQFKPTPMYDYSGTIAAGGTAQLIMPRHSQRSYVLFQNTSSSGNLYVWLGGPTATATLSGSTVGSIAVTNGGFNYTIAPIVSVLGGGQYEGSSGIAGDLGAPNPSGYSHTNTSQNGVLARYRQAMAHCNMTGSAGALSISSITVDDAGAGYVATPYVLIQNDHRDPYGGGLPSATAGYVIIPNGEFVMEASACTTDTIAVFGATTGQSWHCKIIL